MPEADWDSWRSNEADASLLLVGDTNVQNRADPAEAFKHALAALDTISHLESAGISCCGIGRNREEARNPAIVEYNGIRFGFLSYTSVYWPVGHAAGEDTPGVATMKVHTAYESGRRTLEMPGEPPIVLTMPDAEELEMLHADIEDLGSGVDIVVVSFHWGISGSSQLADYQRELGHTAIDAGASVIIGHHPHVPQGIEVWKDKPIFYTLGNFVFDWEKMKSRNMEGLLVRVLVRDGRLNRVSFVPTRRNTANNVEVLNPTTSPGLETVDNVRDLSTEFDTNLTVEGQEIVVGGIG